MVTWGLWFYAVAELPQVTLTLPALPLPLEGCSDSDLQSALGVKRQREFVEATCFGSLHAKEQAAA